MISRKTKLFSAAAVTAVLLTTVAIASSLHKQAAGPHAAAASATSGHAVYDRTFDAASGRTSPYVLDGNFACPLGYVDCATLEMELPQ